MLRFPDEADRIAAANDADTPLELPMAPVIKMPALKVQGPVERWGVVVVAGTAAVICALGLWHAWPPPPPSLPAQAPQIVAAQPEPPLPAPTSRLALGTPSDSPAPSPASPQPAASPKPQNERPPEAKELNDFFRRRAANLLGCFEASQTAVNADILVHISPAGAIDAELTVTSLSAAEKTCLYGRLKHMRFRSYKGPPAAFILPIRIGSASNSAVP